MDHCKHRGTESDAAAVAAAWTLMSMQHSKLDQETAAKLEEMKRMVSQKARDESRQPTRIITESPNQTARTINVVAKHKRSKSSPRVINGDHVSKQKRSKSLKSNETPGLVLPARPPFPELQDFVGSCSRPFQKQITRSDVKKHLSRYMLNSPFFEAHLKPMLHTNVEIIKDGIPVTVFGPGGRGYDMTLKFWCEKYYVLQGTTWIHFCNDYDLESFIHHPATIWMFRHTRTNGLCFAITWSN